LAMALDAGFGGGVWKKKENPNPPGPKPSPINRETRAPAETNQANSPRAVAQTGSDVPGNTQVVDSFSASNSIGLVPQGSIESLPAAGVLYASGSVSVDEDGFNVSASAAVASTGRINIPMAGPLGIALTVDAGSVSTELGLRVDTENPVSNSGFAVGFEASTISAGAGIVVEGENLRVSAVGGYAYGVGATLRIMPGSFRIAVMCGRFIDIKVEW